MRIDPVHVGLAGVIGGTLIIVSLIFFGFQTGQLTTVTEQIAVVQAQNNTAMLILAGVMGEEDPQVRVKMIKNACPKIPTMSALGGEPTLTPAESMCKTLLNIYGNKAAEAEGILEPVEETTEETTPKEETQ